MARRIDNNADGDYSDTSGTPDGTWFYLTDVQFSAVALVDDTAELTERVAYDAYGRARHRWFSDLDGDGDADGNDYFAQIAAQGSGTTAIHADAAYRPDADHDRDGAVDNNDFFAFLNAPSRAALTYGLISDSTGGSPDNPIGYDGYVFAPEAGIVVGTGGAQPQAAGAYCVRFRWYLPETGRWLQRDPAGYVDGMGLLEFVRGNPMAFLDPLGLRSVPPALRAGGRGVIIIGGGIIIIDWLLEGARDIEFAARAITPKERSMVEKVLDQAAACLPGYNETIQNLKDEMWGDSVWIGENMGEIDGFTQLLVAGDAIMYWNLDLLERARREIEQMRQSGVQGFGSRQLSLLKMVLHEMSHAGWDTTEEAADELEQQLLDDLKAALEQQIAEMEEAGCTTSPPDGCFPGTSKEELERMIHLIEHSRNEPVD